MLRRLPPVVAPARLALALCLAAPTGAQRPTPARASADTAALLAQARTFMERYARDLRAGDRAAIVARYDPQGAYFMGMGRKELRTSAEIAAQYAESRWQPPAAFEWQDLSYEVLGPGAVLVVGRFAWTVASGQPPISLSYTGVLRRHVGGLRIRLEDESADPATLPKPAAAPATAPATAPADSARR